MPRKTNINMDALTVSFCTTLDLSSGQMLSVLLLRSLVLPIPQSSKRLEQYKVGYNKWNLTAVEEARQQFEGNIQTMDNVKQNLIPEKDDNFIKFGNFNDIKKVIQSKIFYPTFITGLSGNGKTFGVEQACAQLGRELIRVNITIETDEDDLIGGFRLVAGETVWHNGPVVELWRGAVLLLDELTWHRTRSCVCNLFWRARVYSSRKNW